MKKLVLTAISLLLAASMAYAQPKIEIMGGNKQDWGKVSPKDSPLKTKVKIKNITGEDKELNGLIGTVTHPFAFGETKKGWVGIWLECEKYSGQCNVKVSECEKI